MSGAYIFPCSLLVIQVYNKTPHYLASMGNRMFWLYESASCITKTLIKPNFCCFPVF